MDYAHLGRSGLLVSRIGLGTMNFGDATPEADAYGILDRAVDLGVNFIDSADVYGGPQSPDMAQGYGTSEEVIGAGCRRRATAMTSSWRRSSTSRWVPDRMTAACPRTTSVVPARTACVACRPTTSTSTRCTTSTGRPRSRRSGRRWSSSSRPARSATSAPRTSPGGMSPTPTSPHVHAGAWAGLRAEQLQPHQPGGRAGTHPRPGALRDRSDPLESAGDGCARRTPQHR